MAVTKRFRPRRGKASTLRTKNPVLLAGELIVEVPDAGVGKGAVKMKMGDGTTAYNSLPYAVSPQTNAGDHTITFSASATADNATLLNEIASGKALKSIIGSTKKLLSNFSTSITELNNKYNSFESAKSKIISSGLGSALGMTSSTTIADVATKIATVVNRGCVTGIISTSGGIYSIAAGYHDGKGKVNGPTLASLISTNVNLDSNARLLSGYTAYGKNGTKYTGSHTCPSLSSLIGTSVNLDNAGLLLSGQTAYGKNGTKITGTMVDHRGKPQHIDAVRIANNRFEVAVAAGFHGYYWLGNSYEYLEFSQVASTIGLTAAKLVSGNTVCGVAGSHTCPTLASLVGSNVNLDSNARLLSGYTAYGKNGTKYTGSHTCASLASLVGSNVTLDNAANLLSGVTAYGKNGTKYTGTNQGYTAGYNAGVSAGKTSALTLLGNYNSAKKTSFTVDVKSVYSGYASLTASNFLLEITRLQYKLYDGNATNNTDKVLEYNASTGILTIKKLGSPANTGGTSFVTVYFNLYVKK